MKIKNKSQFQKKEYVLKGNATSPGIALGSVYIFKPLSFNISELDVKIDNTKREVDLFNNARHTVLEQLEYAKLSSDSYTQKEFAEIFESQKAFLNDPILISEITTEINESKMSAAYVVSRILSEKSDHFIKLENTIFP